MQISLPQLNVPLPDCAPGEWGPTKAVKLLGLVPLSHLYPVINAAPDENVVLKVVTILVRMSYTYMIPQDEDNLMKIISSHLKLKLK